MIKLSTNNGFVRHLSCLILFLALGATALAQNALEVSGTVKDANGEPLTGVNILEKGTLNGTMTDLDGNYAIKLTTEDPELVFSFIGFTTQNIKPAGRSTLNVVMKEDDTVLEDVVVIGYGTARKKDLTGAIASVQTEALEAEVPKSFEDLVRAAAPGLYIPMSTNISGGGVNMQIRGKNTLSAASTPLLVVDGVIYNGELNDINPMDIKSVDVLKDASSVAVYGSKAASGVIAVTTKKGTASAEQRPTITFNANIGLAQAANIVKVYDGPGFVSYRQDYFEATQSEADRIAKPQYFQDPRTLNGVSQLDWYNYSQSVPATSLPSEEMLVRQWLTRLNFQTIEQDNYLAGKTVNWDDYIFQTGLQQDYTVGIQHRTERMSYYWSLGYADREGQIIGDRFQNVRSRINTDTKVTDWLNVGMNMQFSNRMGGTVSARTGARTMFGPYAEYTTDKDSPYAQYPSGITEAGVSPQWEFDYIDRFQRMNGLSGSVYAKFSLPFGITFTSTFSPDWGWTFYGNHNSATNPSWSATGGSATRTSTRRYFWQLDNVLNWNKTFGRDHRVEVTLLQNAEKRQNWSETLTSENYSPLDVLGWHSMQSGAVQKIETNDTYMTGDALMARLFYTYKERIMLTASIRRDGNSAFGVQNPRSTFPALALGWVLTDYDFMKPLTKVMNYGKLRLSWGINGNSAISQYAALASLTSSQVPFVTPTGTAYTFSQIYISQMANSGLKWERTESYNLGLDLQFLDGRIKPTFDAYMSTTTNLLVDRSLPSITGYSKVQDNLGKLRNVGFEMGLNAEVIRKENFRWESVLNFSFNRRKLLSLYGDMEDILDDNGNVIGQKEKDDPDHGWFIGRDPDQIWDYEMDGVWQLGQEEEAKQYGLLPGDFRYVDQDKDGSLSSADKVFQGYKTPRYYINWRNNFTFHKNLTLSILSYAQIGQWNTFNKAANYINMADRITGYDLPRWSVNNPINDFARINSTNLGTHYLNKTFLRIESATLTYSLPKKLSDAIHVRNARVSLSVRNPFYYAPHWRWGDPEGGDYTFRTYNLGINFTL